MISEVLTYLDASQASLYQQFLESTENPSVSMISVFVINCNKFHCGLILNIPADVDPLKNVV